MNPRGLPPISPQARAVAEANNLASLLEAAAKGLKHRRHQRTLGPARAAIKGVMASYFSRQKAALLAAIEPEIKIALWHQPPPVLREAATPKGKRFAASLIPTSLSPLKFEVTNEERNDFDRAITESIIGAGKTLAAELGAAKGTTLSEDVAGQYLRDNSLAKLTGGFESTTVDRLRGAIADAWDAGGSYEKIISAIKETMDDFSDARAGMIAQTEANDAYNAGRLAMANEADMDEKSWDPDGEACEEICQPNVEAGWIPLDEDFPSGDDAPSAHPNCFLGDTLISAGGVTAAVRRWYEGQILDVRLIDGHQFSVTPNHPVLGPCGWSAARLLQVGDYVAQCLGPSTAAFLLDPDNHHVETRIEEIGDTLFVAGGMSAAGVPVDRKSVV